MQHLLFNILLILQENLEIENNSEEILKQINNKKKGKKQAVQKHTSKSKQDNSSEDTCDGKTDSDDSHLSKTLEVKQKLNENEHGDVRIYLNH